MLAAYSFENANGEDLTGNGYTLTAQNGSTFSNGVSSNDGVNDYASGSFAALGNTARTLVCWARLTATAADADCVFGIGSGSGSMMDIVTSLAADGRWGVRFRPSARDTPGTVSSASDVGTFVHLAATYSGGNVALYRNGVLVASKTGIAALTTSGLIRVARDGDLIRYCPVELGECAVFSYAFTADQANENYLKSRYRYV